MKPATHIAGLGMFLLVGVAALAQTTSLTPPQTSAKVLTDENGAYKPQAVAPSNPRWIDLTLSQQDSLMPLADAWNALGQTQKRKWIALAQTYPMLGTPEQAKIHSRMAEWAALNPSAHEQARFNFSISKKVAAPERSSHWEAYKALTPQERQTLASHATAKPTGAATSIKPVASEKLTAVPVTRRTPVELRELAFSKQSIDRNTLLPLVPRPVANPSPAKN